MSKHNFDDQAIKRHLELKGKIEVSLKAEVVTEADLSIYYTPGVGAVSRELAKNPKRASELTIKSDMVAVISDGSAVLGLGNVGPEAAMPVMEGKAMLIKKFAGVNAFPICLGTQDSDEIVMTIKNIAPGFAGINLEDIAAPKCFEIEKRLHQELDIPVIHDDQHATAICVLAGLINALKVVGKNKADCRVVIIGSGAAGNGTAKLLHKWGIGDITMVDSKGIVSSLRTGLDVHKQALLKITNKLGLSGDLQNAIKGSDIVLGLSRANLLSTDDIKTMNKDAVVFAMANPTPEITPEEAIAGGAKVVATGRSDYPNQINNVLVFPGMFKGAIETSTNFVSDEIKLRAAKSLAAVVEAPTQDYIIPTVFNKAVVDAIAAAFKA